MHKADSAKRRILCMGTGDAGEIAETNPNPTGPFIRLKCSGKADCEAAVENAKLFPPRVTQAGRE